MVGNYRLQSPEDCPLHTVHVLDDGRGADRTRHWLFDAVFHIWSFVRSFVHCAYPLDSASHFQNRPRARIILQALVSLLILVTLVMGSHFFRGEDWQVLSNDEGAVLFSFVLNSVDVIVGLAALMLALLLLLHRLVWPTVERPTYAMERFGFIKRKKLLWTAGIVLVLPTYTIFQLLTSLLDRL